MDTKRHTYRLVGMFTSLIYLTIILLSIFEVEDFNFMDVTIKILSIFFTPAIFLIFSGIGEILDGLEKKEVSNASIIDIKEETPDDAEPVQMEFSLDDTKEKTSDTTENTDATEDDNIEVDKDNTKDENDDKAEEEDNSPTYNYEPDIKNGKIRCRYCGKYNKEKRTYCYLCAKKLKD